MKKIAIPILFILLVLLAATFLQARPTTRFDDRTQMCRLIAEGRLDWESEPWGTGGKKFQEVCKGCHAKGNDQDAPFLHAESYVSNGWNRIFATRRVRCATNGSWQSLSEEEIQLIADYLYRNAAWSYNPNSSDSC